MTKEDYQLFVRRLNWIQRDMGIQIVPSEWLTLKPCAEPEDYRVSTLGNEAGTPIETDSHGK
jgi:hypothetical protein